MTQQTQQADGEIHEDQLPNFFVKHTDEEITLSLGADAETGSEDIYEVFLGAFADGTPISAALYEHWRDTRIRSNDLSVSVTSLVCALMRSGSASRS